jgi:hypothetical protein
MIIKMIEEYLKEIIDAKFEERIKDLIYELGQVKPPEKEFYNIEEVAIMLGLTISGLKARRKSGKIEMVNEQNAILVHKKELERYKKQHLYKQMKKERG